ncbi:hypothetical protein PVT71_00085 [Salipiger sp. H15]|uniref:ParB/Sulfiredoxin domain-containing protein n=1 Tax=Alloyangia sp. H15 TaxID=3029062 RepID=A0AAU8AGN5_9RHOB
MGMMRKQYHSRRVGADRHSWDVHRLVRLSRGLPVETIAVSDIAEIDELWWYQPGDGAPTPRSIAEHMRLVDETDLRWPILLCAEGRLMDGMHRVVKAMKEGRSEIRAVRFRPTPEPDFVNVDVNTLPYPDEEV